MDARSAALAYRESSLENAPPIKIVRLMYEGAIRFLDRAVAAHGEGADNRTTHWLARADAIIAELRCSLDRSHDAQLCEQLDQLYVFVQDQIARSIVEKQLSTIPDARSVLVKLLDGWSQIELATAATEST